MNTSFGTVARGVGFRNLSGEVKRTVTKIHTLRDVGQTFIDNFGRSYVYTKQGLIY